MNTSRVATLKSSRSSSGSSADAAAAQLRRLVQDGQRMAEAMSSTSSAVSLGGALR
jgi:hypothetical protein